MPKARGGSREEQPHVQGAVAAWAQEGLEEPSNVESQEGWWEEIPLIQGKEQGLCFAGAAIKRYRMPEIRSGGGEEQSHIQRAVAAQAQEGREEQLHIQDQEGRPHAR